VKDYGKIAKPLTELLRKTIFLGTQMLQRLLVN
jgi:hypothetical protein